MRPIAIRLDSCWRGGVGAIRDLRAIGEQGSGQSAAPMIARSLPFAPSVRSHYTVTWRYGLAKSVANFGTSDVSLCLLACLLSVLTVGLAAWS